MKKKTIRTLVLMIGIALLTIPIILDYRLYISQKEDIEKFNSALTIKKENDNSIIDLNKQNQIAVIYIPKIKVTLPVYEGTSELAISNGVGHLEGTDNIGEGIGTHSVLTSHSGLSINQLFTTLYKLKKNDVWYVKDFSDKIYKYKTIEINKVLPTEVDKLARKSNKELMTLITCTPLFVNTHRLLVMGENVPVTENVTFKPNYNFLENNKTYLLIVGTCVLIIYLYSLRKRKE